MRPAADSCPVVAADQYHYDQPDSNSNIDAVDWTTNITTWNIADFTARQTGKVHVDQTFNVATMLCVST
jgi:hypothetical protein